VNRKTRLVIHYPISSIAGTCLKINDYSFNENTAVVIPAHAGIQSIHVFRDLLHQHREDLSTGFRRAPE